MNVAFLEESSMSQLRNALIFAAFGILTVGTSNAATANFQGNCTNSTVGGQLRTVCSFSPNKAPAGQSYTSCGGAGVSSYGWTFGDGSSTTTYPSIDFGRASHTYIGTVALTVSMTVYCSNGATATASHCLENSPPPTGGCIYPGLGWAP